MSVAIAQKTTAKPHYTYADYATWPDYPRFELINGEAFKMGAPSEAHQAVLIALSSIFWNFLRGKQCRVYMAPFDVRINFDTTDDTVVQPDLVVICDRSKLENGKHCLGVPDLAVEILSESNMRHDKIRKFNVYLNAGVREYWIIDPHSRAVEVYLLENGKYHVAHYDDTSKIPVSVLDGFEVDMAEVFEDMILEAPVNNDSNAGPAVFTE